MYADNMKMLCTESISNRDILCQLSNDNCYEVNYNAYLRCIDILITSDSLFCKKENSSQCPNEVNYKTHTREKMLKQNKRVSYKMPNVSDTS